ncbi:Mak10 subunit, NatC N-terminal acetyltransferase-domain-containing protein [Mycena albidolilacea]|uniref:Mak10 subunit, NatC N-terminal acetyltransferase-domain-containing protein n=1 Tax=Mycena albidolilacea TaxID=1033008 RepID=A0AAD7A3I7_9AGAR|nr:Mak10 subunit, NatC N-terminal acetyltransferase-domain-containing protein [Mycena albidolilacea]
MESLAIVDLPGGDNFRDVTNIFVEAAAEMEPGGLILRDGFTLQDAMSAFEIGEPRLDSGMAGDADERPPFDIWDPLLPQEICWIIDRSFTLEMLWHAGNTLAHTVFTCLYALVVSELHPDMLPYGLPNDVLRPPQLIPVVLRASICGMLKSCDLSWRELSKGHVHDTEDWQSDKGDTSLLEGMSVQNVIATLDGATAWLIRSRKVPDPWATALVARLNLRKALLQLMDANIFKTPSDFIDLINVARNHLKTVRTYPSPAPGPGSTAHLVFDPYIARKLNSTVPIRVIDVPPVNEAWHSIDVLLDGWEEQRLLSLTANVSTWELVGNLRTWLPNPPLRTPYVRSSTQSVFYDGLLVLNKFSPTWVIDRFFFETLGVSYSSIFHFVDRNSQSQRPPPWADIQRGHFKLMTEYIRALWYNPCRRRRFFMKALVDLHVYYTRLTDIAANLPSDLPRTHVMKQLPACALVWRLSVIREVVLSGFQLELYTSEEKPFAYWYASQVMDAHLACLDDMLLAVEPDCPASRELRFQHSLLSALQAMTIPMFALSMPLMSFAWRQMHANFLRRYKWAFGKGYELSPVAVVAPPDFNSFTDTCGRILQDKTFSPLDSFSLAHSIVMELIESRSVGGCAGLWTDERIQLLRNIARACERLRDVPSSMAELPSFDVGLLKWDPQTDPWFPVLEREGAERRRNKHVRRVEPYPS